jgi:hypothetical protein
MFLHGKKKLSKKKKNDDFVTKFWYTLKNLHSKPIYYLPTYKF